MIYFANIFKIIFFSLYAPITSDECHAWFHMYAISPGAKTRNQVFKVFKMAAGLIVYISAH